MTTLFTRSDDLIPQKLPKYTYLPGVTPHPVSDAAGHARGMSRPVATGSLATGIRLLNHGFYWEAHEVWEAEWIAAGRTSAEGNLIKGFIKLAACGVKCLEGNSAGAVRHAIRAKELFQRSLNQPEFSASTAGIRSTIQFASKLAFDPPMATSEQQLLAKTSGVPLFGPLPELIPESPFAEEDSPRNHPHSA